MMLLVCGLLLHILSDLYKLIMVLLILSITSPFGVQYKFLYMQLIFCICYDMFSFYSSYDTSHCCMLCCLSFTAVRKEELWKQSQRQGEGQEVAALGIGKAS